MLHLPSPTGNLFRKKLEHLLQMKIDGDPIFATPFALAQYSDFGAKQSGFCVVKNIFQEPC